MVDFFHDFILPFNAFPDIGGGAFCHVLLHIFNNIIYHSFEYLLCHKKIQKKYPPNLFLIDVSHFLFVFYSIFYFFKSLKRKLTSLCCSKDCWRGYMCTPSWAQTHMIAHTKGEPRARLSNPFFFLFFFCRKPILKTINSFSISDYIHYPINSLVVNYYV